MTVQLSTVLRNARLDAIETAIGPNGKLKILTGSPPANTAASNTGTVVSTIELPADWMASASGGSKAMLGTWADASTDAPGTAAYFRFYEADGVTCHLQGTVSQTGGGGDMTLDNVVFAAGQNFQITSFVLTDGNA